MLWFNNIFKDFSMILRAIATQWLIQDCLASRQLHLMPFYKTLARLCLKVLDRLSFLRPTQIRFLFISLLLFLSPINKRKIIIHKIGMMILSRFKSKFLLSQITIRNFNKILNNSLWITKILVKANKF